MEEDSGGIFSETYKKLKTWINIILNLKDIILYSQKSKLNLRFACVQFKTFFLVFLKNLYFLQL